MTATSSEIYYRSEDAQQILQIAMERQAEMGELTRTQLFEIAAELNIAPDDIVAAEQQWQARQGELAERQAFDRMRWLQFRSRLVRFLIVSGFLVALNWLIGGGFIYYLSLLIGLGWGTGMALTAWKTFGLSEEDYYQAFQQWRQRRQLKQSVTRLVNRWLGVPQV